ncbi:hypothetical protein Misp01_35490 [Microtetraspora sp. NBRC 13810]|uniref:serine/threonine protein kinase n=1 Tax=Microtetraspora sp. NBRC 13810 TaxID=3030990 RepID=UPI0024A2D75B|nr:PASTA domain-containing protein [Microtetraspora sp. NBRC 13810]GLW08419.1 hypothetical protein Misp01_35490 [Microtetraspora sp. NBRC 13810]
MSGGEGRLLVPQAQPLKLGDPARLGEYELVGRLGAGGQGVVYLAFHPRAGADHYAVKLLHQSVGDDAADFLREVELAKQVARFCTAQVIGAGVAEGQPYIVSEYVDGPSLHQEVALAGPRSGGALERLAISTATALAAIHQAGIVHRDFKPHNVLLGPDGPRVIDFGLARALDAAATLSGRGAGTPAYMAPEQVSASEITPAADVFAWGATMCFAASGHAPFGQDSIPAVLHRILTARPDTARIGGRLRDLVESCLAKAPSARPTSRDLLLHLLSASPPGTPLPLPPDAAPPRDVAPPADTIPSAGAVPPVGFVSPVGVVPSADAVPSVGVVPSAGAVPPVGVVPPAVASLLVPPPSWSRPEPSSPPVSSSASFSPVSSPAASSWPGHSTPPVAPVSSSRPEGSFPPPGSAAASGPEGSSPPVSSSPVSASWPGHSVPPVAPLNASGPERSFPPYPVPEPYPASEPYPVPEPSAWRSGSATSGEGPVWTGADEPAGHPGWSQGGVSSREQSGPSEWSSGSSALSSGGGTQGASEGSWPSEGPWSSGERTGRSRGVAEEEAGRTHPGRAATRAGVAVSGSLLVSAAVLVAVLVPALTSADRREVDEQAVRQPPATSAPLEPDLTPSQADETRVPEEEPQPIAQQPAPPRSAAVVTVQVPELIGMDRATAERAIKRAGLVLGDADAVDSPEKIGRVLAALPAPGDRVTKGSKVSLEVSAGLKVPEVAGLRRSAAESALTGAGLSVGQLSRVCATDAETGQVVASDPAAGQRVPGGAPVSLTVAQRGTPVPPVVGAGQAEARRSLRAAGLAVRVQARIVDTADRFGSVIGQDPAPGACGTRGTTVTITVAVEGTTLPIPGREPSPGQNGDDVSEEPPETLPEATTGTTTGATAGATTGAPATP